MALFISLFGSLPPRGDLLLHPETHSTHAMYISTFFIPPCIVAFTVLSLPHSHSILQLPSRPLSINVSNATSTLLGDWPNPPYQVDVGEVTVTVQRYGRHARPEYRPVVVRAIEMYRNYFLSKKSFVQTRPVFLTSGIVKLLLQCNGGARMTGEDVWAALLPLQLAYADPGWSLKEIANGEIDLASSHHAPAATFQIAFTQV